jgi:DNA-binding NarL/FixJ family response regulator
MMVILLSADKFIIERFMSAFEEKTHAFKSYEELRAFKEPSAGDVVVVDTATAEAFDVTKLASEVLILASVPSVAECVRYFRYGVKGYGNRMMRPGNMKQAVETLRSGQVWMPPDILSRIIMSVPDTEADEENVDISQLTERELEVAYLVSEGKTNAEIAEKADITVRTVKAHMTSIFNKTGLRDRVALALAFKHKVTS